MIDGAHKWKWWLVAVAIDSGMSFAWSSAPNTCKWNKESRNFHWVWLKMEKNCSLIVNLLWILFQSSLTMIFPPLLAQHFTQFFETRDSILYTMPINQLCIKNSWKKYHCKVNEQRDTYRIWSHRHWFLVEIIPEITWKLMTTQTKKRKEKTHPENREYSVFILNYSIVYLCVVHFNRTRYEPIFFFAGTLRAV